MMEMWRNALARYNDTEFKTEHSNAQFESQIMKRKAKQIASHIFEDKNFITLNIGAATTVFTIGFLEGFMLMKRQPQALLSLQFCARYASAQILPSIIWGTKEASQVVRSMGYAPSLLLRELSETKQRHAKVLLRVNTLFCLRSVVAGFVGIGQILRLVDITQEATEHYKKRVVMGKEPMVEGVNERIIRLAGSTSDVTELSISRLGHHIIPVIEDPHLVQDMIEECTQGGRFPGVFHIGDKMYGKRSSYRGFHITRDALITTKSGRKLLVIEADSCVGEEALALSKESAKDLTMHEASLAFRMFEKLARESGAMEPQDRTIRILLADSHQPVFTGAGRIYTLRDHVNEFTEADIFIDSKLPLIAAVLNWADGVLKAHGREHKKEIIFDTRNTKYYETMTRYLKSRGWKVLDRPLPSDKEQHIGVPRLCYYNNTADTVNTITNLIENNRADPTSCCALVDAKEGLETLEDLTKVTGVTVHAVCSAMVYDEIFTAVRRLLRQDVQPEDIQKMLDEYYAP